MQQEPLPQCCTTRMLPVTEPACAHAGARERYYREKERLDKALALLREGAERVPAHLSAAFRMHSDAYAAAARALEAPPPMMLNTPRSNQHTPKVCMAGSCTGAAQTCISCLMVYLVACAHLASLWHRQVGRCCE